MRSSRRLTQRLGALVAALVASLVALGTAVAGVSAHAGATTLTIWHYAGPTAPDGVLYAKFAKDFEKTHKNVKIKLEYIPPNNITQKLVAAASQHQGPDVVIYNGANAPALVKAKALYNMTSFWKHFPAGKLFSKATVRRIGKRVYGAQPYVNLVALWYNQDILNKAGVQPPRTIADLSNDLAAVQKAGGSRGLIVDGTPDLEGEWQAGPWLFGYGVDYNNMSVANLTPVFSQISSWVKAGYIPPTVSSLSQIEGFQQFLVGDVAFTVNGNWEIGDAASNAKFKYGVVPFPTGPNGSHVYLGGETVSMGAFSKNPALTWQFLKSTFFTRSGELQFLTKTGSLPSRSDAATSPLIAKSPILRTYAKAVTTGVPLPAGVKITGAQIAVAQSWSTLLSGQGDPQSLAQSTVSKVNKALGK